MTQHNAVIETLKRLGGIATLGQLYQEVFKIKDCKWETKTPYASIRQIVQVSKETYKIKPGLWALISHKKELEKNGIVVEDKHNADSKEVQEFNHSYYQGLLLEIGNYKGLQTFVPNQDKNKRYTGKTLQEVCTLDKIPEYSYSGLVERSSTIDVIWFIERKSKDMTYYMPCNFFEIEHTTDIQNSLLKYYDLQDFYTKMFIVADEKREEEFKSKLNYGAFKELVDNERVSFLSYNSLNRLYNLTIEEKKCGLLL